jgi:5-(carboxyamino)imidazole ribonucleotide synthase
MPALPDTPLAPGGTIGILGGGQLGRMLAMAAARLGFSCHIYSDKDEAPAAQVARAWSHAPFDDEAALDRFARAVDVVTFEFENVPAAALARIAETAPVAPPMAALEVAQDRLREKELARALGIGTADFAPVGDVTELCAALERIGRPALLKTRRLGYDGKGQVKIDTATDPQAALAALRGAPAILERFVPFEREISILAVRGRDGGLAFYDPAENRHSNQILHETRVPARIPDALADRAAAIAEAIASELAYVGVLCVELFVQPGGTGAELLVNEIAPRVHNSGHWTLEACAISQFENHIRAVAGWPLGTTTRHSDAVMTNLIGEDAADWQRLAAEPGLALHLYGKGEARAGRKMGHVTRLSPRPRA